MDANSKMPKKPRRFIKEYTKNVSRSLRDLDSGVFSMQASSSASSWLLPPEIATISHCQLLLLCLTQQTVYLRAQQSKVVIHRELCLHPRQNFPSGFDDRYPREIWNPMYFRALDTANGN